jgi:4-amino-4-deoxy-L-arabinose transferase-like glycosyltransferase
MSQATVPAAPPSQCPAWGRLDPRATRRRLAGGPGPLLLLLAALIPRLLWINSFDWRPFNDAAWYQQSAVDLAHGLGYLAAGRPTAYFPIGYPGFLAGLFLVFPADQFTVALANVALGAGLVLVSLRLFREIGLSEAEARWTALLIALCPTLVLYASLGMTETLFTFLLLSGTSLLLVARRSPSAALAAGLVFGAATLVRSQVLLLPACMLLSLLVLQSWRAGRVLRVAALLYLGLACVVAPWTLRNWLVLGTPVLVSTNDGANLLLGNNPETRWGSGYPVTARLAQDLEGVTYTEQRTPPDEAGWDRRVRARALSYIAADPLHYLLLWPRKIQRHFGADELVFDLNGKQAALAGADIHHVMAVIAPLRDLFHVAQIGLLLFGLGLAIGCPWLRPAVLFCALPVAYFAALSCLFFGEPRFNFPAIPFLIGGGVFVAAALWRALLPSPTR